MKKLICEMCGSADLLKQDGLFVCQNCGTKYTPEEARKMMIEGTVDVQGTVKVDNTDLVEKYLANARRAYTKRDWEEVEKYYNMVEQNAPNNMEAVFFSSYGKAMLSLTDSEYFKREQKFGVLNRSISVLSDYYEVTTENKEETLKRINEAIKAMYGVSFVYDRQDLDLSGALRTFSGSTGTKQWCKNLLDTTKAAFYTELRQIAAKHNDTYIQELLRDNGLVSLESQDKPIKSPKEETSKNSNNTNAIILGILGIVFAWLLAILGHVFCICGIVAGVKANKNEGKIGGLIISVIGEICAVISSIIGIVSVL